MILPLAVLAVFLAWEIVSTTASSDLSASDPETAIGWRPSSPVALVGLSEQSLRDEEGGETGLAIAEDAATEALRIDPLESDALRLLGFVAAARGDQDRAAALMQAALSRNPRDLRSQGWMFVRSATTGDFEAAVGHLDAMLRARPDTGQALLPALVEVATMPAVAPALAARLQENPPWRLWFLENVSRTAEPRRLTELFNALRETDAPPSDREVRTWLSRLASRGFYELAYLNWIMHLPPARLASVGRVTNGGFEEPLNGLPFEWRISRSRGAETRIAESAAGDNALRISFYGGRMPYQQVEQLMLLPAGRYRLSGQVRPDNLVNERGMQWTLTCAGEPKPFAATERVSGSSPWTPFQLDFDIRNDGTCRAQLLRLELAARVPAEQEARGEIWYDDLAVERLPDGEIATPG